LDGAGYYFEPPKRKGAFGWRWFCYPVALLLAVAFDDGFFLSGFFF